MFAKVKLIEETLNHVDGLYPGFREIYTKNDGVYTILNADSGNAELRWILNGKPCGCFIRKEHIDSFTEVSGKEYILKCRASNTYYIHYFDEMQNYLPLCSVKDSGIMAVWRAKDDPNKIGYLPIERVTPEYFANPYNIQLFVNQGFMARPGKFYRKLMQAAGKPVGTREIEDFLQKFIVQDLEIREVFGKDIKYWYHEKNYSEKLNLGTLGHSCMRYSCCQDYFGIYTENPDKVGLIITVDDQNELVGRALTWRADDGNVYYDRVYSETIRKGSIVNWAEARGYRPCYEKACSLEVSLDYYNFDEYPYLDTFMYIDMTKGCLHTGHLEEDRELQSTSGGYSGDNRMTCDCCGEYMDDDESTVVDGDLCVCPRCLRDYIWVESRDTYIHEDEVVCCEYCSEAFYDSDISTVHVFDEGITCLCERCLEDFIEDGGVYYPTDTYEFCSECGEVKEIDEECECQIEKQGEDNNDAEKSA